VYVISRGKLSSRLIWTLSVRVGDHHCKANLCAVPRRRVHFGGEVVKLRTPDSEDAESVASEARQRSARTRIPVPVSPATRMPSGRRARSSSQPGEARTRSAPRRRSASSSPKRESHTHDASLSPKKGILAKSSEFAERQSRYARTSTVISRPTTRNFKGVDSRLPSRNSSFLFITITLYALRKRIILTL
jgi:hypothetical protein